MKVILWVWCFPQMLLGFVVKTVTRAKIVDDHYEYHNKYGSVSLGEYIFICEAHKDDPTVLAHELGHRKQSRRLGWLYLLVIGVPSIIWSGLFKSYRKKHNVSYYDFYTEKWADSLAGIQR